MVAVRRLAKGSLKAPSLIVSFHILTYAWLAGHMQERVVATDALMRPVVDFLLAYVRDLSRERALELLDKRLKGAW
jgi:hypothetical protein